MRLLLDIIKLLMSLLLITRMYLLLTRYCQKSVLIMLISY
nr:MAG TPA: hypothetical protein [Caudoviricetes sp.]